MTIRVGTTEADPTHHIKLRDRAGISVGLILCNDKGEPAPIYNKNPIERTALKTQSGGGSYSDFDYPYAPIVQDDWSGGRGNRDFERDSTRYFDGYRVNTRHENKVLLGPQEHFSKGYKSLLFSPNLEKRYRIWGAIDTWLFPLSATITAARIWFYARYTGTTPSNFSIEIKTDGITVASGTFSQDYRVDYKVGSWIYIDINATLTTGGVNTITCDDASWEFEHSIDGYLAGNPISPVIKYVLEAATVDDSVIYFEYKGQQYKVISPAGGTPTVWMNGDRGAADINSGFLTLLIDATKTWTEDQWVGCVAKIIQGTGKTEKVLYRTITSNVSTGLETDAWTITQDTTTEYVILGSDTWQEVTGHGLTVPVTDVLVVGEVVYFAQGDSVLIRSYRAYNNAGTWTSEWRAEGIATNFAEFLEYEPLSGKIWRAQNKDATGIVSVSSTTNSIAYGTDLVFNAVIPVSDKYSFINGIEVYPAENGTVALWVYKEELAYVVTTQAEGIKLVEMRAMRSRGNGASSLVHNVYSYFTLGNGLQRYYGGNLDSVGPNIDDGLPPERSGPIINLMGYPGRIMAIVDGGDEGYSSLMERSGSGWHEIYRAPFGERLKGMALQVIPGTTTDRLWLYQGNMSIWLPIAGEGVDETLDPNYTYAFEGAIIISRMHAGMFDIQKLIKVLKIWSDGLNPYTEGTVTSPPDNDVHQYLQINLDYKLDEDTEWTALTGNLITSPVSSIDLSSVYGIAGKRIQLRVRMQSGDRTITPKLLAVIVEAVLRVQIKYMYNLTFRVMDDEPSLTPREMDDMSVTAAGQSAITKLAQIESWADADTDSLLYMTSNSPLYNGKYVFINPPTTRQIATDPDPTRQWTGNGFVCSTTVQEA